MPPQRDRNSPSLAWLVSYLGREIRVRREAAGMTQAKLGRCTYSSSQLVSAIEGGTRVPQQSFVLLADRSLDADGALTRLWEELSEGTTPLWFQRYQELEEVAVQLRSYEPQLIPGLLQTEAYARWTFSHRQPPHPVHKLEPLVQARMTRGDLLTREDPLETWFVLDEAVLHRWPRDASIRRPQLERLLELGVLPNVTIQVIEFGVGHHAAMEGFMSLLSFPEGDDCGYVEFVAGGVVVSDPVTLETMRRRYGLLVADALSPDASKKFIESLWGSA